MDEEDRMEVILTAKTLNELKIKIKRYYNTYNKEWYNTIVKNTYEEEGIFKVLINRIK